MGSIVWMVLLFAGRLASLLTPPGTPIIMNANRADGVSDGSTIKFLGTEVGRVIHVKRAADNVSVIIDAEVNKTPPLPSNLRAVIQPQSAFGSAANISLELVGDKPSDKQIEPNQELEAEYEGSSLLPKQVTQLAEEVRRQQLILHLDQTVLSIKEQSERAGQVFDSVQKLLGNDKLRDDLQDAMANIRSAAESASRAGNNLDKFTGNLQQVADKATDTMSDVRVAAVKLGSVLDRLDSITNKIDQGKGTAGLLVNDARLYQGLVDTSKDLNLTIKDLQRVVLQWEQEGVSLKLK
jgi:phospholipid/cholesterol/gamma-HCH transport system substrate-binding protein